MRAVFRATPVSLFDLAGLEGWLEERANEGLFPKWITGDFTLFYREEAVPGTRFRLEDANGREEPEAEQLELYRQAGWRYAHTVGRMYFLFYTADASAPEPHTDPATQAVSLDALVKRLKKGRLRLMIWRLVILALLGLVPLLVLLEDARRLPLFLLSLTGPLLIFLILFLVMWRQDERNYRKLLELHRALEQGTPLQPRAPTVRAWWQRLAMPALAVLFVVLFAAKWLGGNCAFPFLGERRIPLEGFSRPYVLLASLESEPVVPEKELFGPSSWSEDHNTVKWNVSLLAPEWYSVSQTLLSLHGGEKKGFSPVGDGEYWYTCHLDAVYFRLTVPALARPVAKAQMAQMEAVNLDWRYEELDCSGLDFALLARSGSAYQLAAVAQGNCLAVFRYGGREDLAQHLPQLAEGLTCTQG